METNEQIILNDMLDLLNTTTSMYMSDEIIKKIIQLLSEYLNEICTNKYFKCDPDISIKKEETGIKGWFRIQIALQRINGRVDKRLDAISNNEREEGRNLRMIQHNILYVSDLITQLNYRILKYQENERLKSKKEDEKCIISDGRRKRKKSKKKISKRRSKKHY